ncbi:MAG: RHH-type proline utilization regulon transcriptional repressor/proline dehydrogenase [Halioglobus sp.]|jgi:RHH-type proline utilization regulon transcriptional repressor/proline dehydrogenase/delta 1-pyrroline-5-carboxylate dehydrogenase
MSKYRDLIRQNTLIDENSALRHLLGSSALTVADREQICQQAATLVRKVREEGSPSLMELFLGEYGLSTEEGVALMCLAEALLRVPDSSTMTELIEDKIVSGSWGEHLGGSHSSLINASTWALLLTGKMLQEKEGQSISQTLRRLIKRTGEPVVRQAASRVMAELGRQFVLGQTIGSAISRAEKNHAKGILHSFDMLGEAARTESEADRYYESYRHAIEEIGFSCNAENVHSNPGISIKLSALHPRYEPLKKAQLLRELVPKVRSLALLASERNIGFTIDAEEADRLDLSLSIIERVLSDPALTGWKGFGIVVQAYGKRAMYVIDWIHELAQKLDRHIMVRLVKGAYWDSEIKTAQEQGLSDFPVFTRKPTTDVSFICCVEKLFSMNERIYPQFATHSAHSVAVVLALSPPIAEFELQRLHGMGESLHSFMHQNDRIQSRIYAPVGKHKDLLAYLVRRLLENGANSSFVNQIVNQDVSAEEIAFDPLTLAAEYIDSAPNPRIAAPSDLFAPGRRNSSGWDMSNPNVTGKLSNSIAPYLDKARHCNGLAGSQSIRNPMDMQVIGSVKFCSALDVSVALSRLTDWSSASANERANVLRRAADVFEKNADEIFALLICEAGKTINDCIGELREAVDFLRFYAGEAQRLNAKPVGLFACIAPWNFPLAIFTGQIAAALASGNGVAAKPADSTPLIACLAVKLLHQAGVPESCLSILPGTGPEVGVALTTDSRINGVCFTGSTATAKIIDVAISRNLRPDTPFIAETGGINAMIIDSSALLQQAVDDVITSAFQSAGQRCSALRVLYIQGDIEQEFVELLAGAMDSLQVGDPGDFATDIGPMCDYKTYEKVVQGITQAKDDGRLMKQLAAPATGCFIGPALVRVDGIGDIPEELFGPVLHIARFSASELDNVVDAINGAGYGLTFGMHSRIDSRIQRVIRRLQIGNIYVNRNQIGAVVESQPFGGEGLSGTGPKAGGPHYLGRFMASEFLAPEFSPPANSSYFTAADIEEAFATSVFQSDEAETATVAMAGPTGESNRLSLHAKKRVLCLGPGRELAEQQCLEARRIGCQVIAIAVGVTDGLSGEVEAAQLKEVEQLQAVVYWSMDRANEFRRALSEREGPIVPLVMSRDLMARLTTERHICINTTAVGGNTSLLAGA